MREDARVRIDQHRLIRTSEEDERIGSSVSDARHLLDRHRRLVRRVWVHSVVFILAYIFTAGASVLGVLLWVRPDGLFALVLVGLFAALCFVGSFTTMRFVVLHRLLDEYPNTEEDPGDTHHIGKSIAYGLVALVVAAVVTGLLVNLAAAAGPVS